MYYCIIISFISIFEKHLTSLSEHRSFRTGAKDEYNEKETMRVFCKNQSSGFKSFDR